MNLNELKDSRMQEIITLVERYLPLNRWGFKQAVYFFYNKRPIVIYASEKCRIRIDYLAYDPQYLDPNIVIFYGRSEVRDNADILPRHTQVNRYNRFWHGVHSPLYFLDGYSPRQAKAQEQPRLIREFDQSDVAWQIKYTPERDLVLYAKIWETYGQQLFDIFDNRNKDLWKRYCAFEKELWEAWPLPETGTMKKTP